jgi:hypothetical protein
VGAVKWGVSDFFLARPNENREQLSNRGFLLFDFSQEENPGLAHLESP